MTPTTPLTFRYRELVTSGTYEIDTAALAAKLVERLFAGSSPPAAR